MLNTPNTICHLPEPEPWRRPVPGETLLDDLAERLSRHVALPNHAPETLALWVLHTFAFELRDVSTYVGIESPEKRCGKTTLLRLLGQMVSRPVIAANISPPALFRVIAEAHPTLLIDEADTFLSGKDEMRGILNSGYERTTAYVVRVGGSERKPRTPKHNSRLHRFSCWCPKAIACIGRLPETLADRCITIRMQRRVANEHCIRLRDYRDDGLRSKCARFALDNAGAIRDARPEIPTELNDRASDIWEPLLVLADIAGGRWPAAAREAALSITADNDLQTPVRALLMDIFIIFTAAKADRMFTRDLLQRLEDFGDRPYKDLTKGKPLTGLWLGSQLRPYGVEAKTLWLDNYSSKGYLAGDFAQAFRRYMSKKDVQDFINTQRALHSQPTIPQPAKNAFSPSDVRPDARDPQKVQCFQGS